MLLASMVFRNQLFHIKKVVPVVLLVGMMIFISVTSVLLVSRIKEMADKPLLSLKTGLIMQNESGGKESGKIRTRGVILPFNLKAFSLRATSEKLDSIKGIESYSTALVLWEFDLKNTRTMVALRKNDPKVGLRTIESFLEPGGRFFRSDSAKEVILERHFAKLFGYELGRFFMIGPESFRIIGIVDFKEQSNLSNASIFLPYETALQLSGNEDSVINQAYISLGSSASVPEITTILEGQFPGYSLITKDSLFKNLSSFNRLLYRFGDYFVFSVIPLSLLLTMWIMKIHMLEFKEQTKILRTLGWPKARLLAWRLWDAGFIIGGAVILTIVLTVVLQHYFLQALEMTPLLNQGFQL